MTLHHLQQRTHPLGFDWLIPRGSLDEGYFVGSFESQLHTTHTRVRFFSPATSGAPQRPTLQDQRERTRGLQLASPATTVNQTVSANSATCTITARSTTASPLTEANTFPARLAPSLLNFCYVFTPRVPVRGQYFHPDSCKRLLFV